MIFAAVILAGCVSPIEIRLNPDGTRPSAAEIRRQVQEQERLYMQRMQEQPQEAARPSGCASPKDAG